MIFVTGPLFAGKQEFISGLLGWSEDDFQANAVRDVQELAGAPGEGFSRYDAADLEELADRLAQKQVVIATEIGGGVVPADPEERRKRERAGRLACLLAERADTVIRVQCGLPRILKGEWPC